MYAEFKELNDDQRDHYKSIATADKQRFETEMNEFRVKLQEH